MIRALAVAGALIGCAFFALVIRQNTSTDAAFQRLDRAAAPARTQTLIDHADKLNPDSGADLLKARLALQQRRFDDARRILLDVVEKEPANLDAWAVIAVAFRDSDPALFDRAIAANRRYNPPVPEP